MNNGSEIVNEIMDVVENWKKFAQEAGVVKLYSNEIEKNLSILRPLNLSLIQGVFI